MEMIKLEHLFAFLIVQIVSGQLVAQDNLHDKGVSDQMFDKLEQTVKANFGQGYKVSDVIDPDSLYPGKFPLLNGKFIFGAEGSSAPFIGITDGNQIIWTSDREMSISLSPRISQILDLNNDQKPDILVLCTESNGSDELWIYKWDGTGGNRINPLNPITQGLSAMGSFDTPDAIEFVDTNGDGIMEIRLSVLDKDTSIYFYWNGIQFTEGTPGPFTALPRNRLNIELSAYIEKVGDGVRCHYSIFNKISSQQSADDFLLEPAGGINIIDITGRKNWKPASGPLFVRWTNLFWSGGENYINPGKKDTSFSILRNGLPVIAKYYVQGHNGDEFSGSGIETNSVNGYTICPVDVPNPFLPTEFLDTLISFTRQSVTLGWLAQKKDLDTSNGESAKDSIATNLIKRLQTIKTTLQQGDSVGAHTLLQNFLTKVDAEHARSTNRMSDECYALLRYNGEYLRDKQPSQ
jgi:FG-GAP-like repeat